MSRNWWPRYGDAALFAYLTLLAWGLTAPFRGFWQDDTLHFSFTVRARDGLPATLFKAFGTPMRHLVQLPNWMASLTPRPVLTLQLIYGFFWVSVALAVGWIASLLLPRPLVRFAAIALTLTATSDYLTANLTSIGYNFAVLTILLAIGAALRFVIDGGAFWLIVSAAFLSISEWTVDLAFIVVPFFAFLLLFPARRRALLLLAACAAVTLPAAIAEWRFLNDPDRYASGAFLPLTPRELAVRVARHFLWNFTPWSWVFSRPRMMGLRPPVLMPMAIMAALAIVAAIAFYLRARQLSGAPAPPPALSLAMLFCVMALVCNTVYAGLQMADIHNRTHVMSRIWTSLAIAIAAGWAASRWPRARPAVLAALAIFIGFGAWGGLERQDLFLSTWRMHQRELVSIVESVPAYRDGTGIILRSGATPFYMATEADYLTESWFVLLYDQPRVHTLRLTPARDTECRATPSGLDCRHEANMKRKGLDHFDYDKLIVLDYDARRGRYELVRSLPNAAAYQPERLIVRLGRRRPLTARQQHLLLLD